MRLFRIARFASLALATSCVTINGKSYSSATRQISELVCKAAPSLENLRVVVNEWRGRPLPGTRVRVVQEPAGGIDAGITDVEGTAVFAVGPDTWRVRVWLRGYSPGRRTVQIRTGQVCVVTFYLRFSDQIDPTFLLDSATGFPERLQKALDLSIQHDVEALERANAYSYDDLSPREWRNWQTRGT